MAFAWISCGSHVCPFPSPFPAALSGALSLWNATQKCSSCRAFASVTVSRKPQPSVHHTCAQQHRIGPQCRGVTSSPKVFPSTPHVRPVQLGACMLQGMLQQRSAVTWSMHTLLLQKPESRDGEGFAAGCSLCVSFTVLAG